MDGSSSTYRGRSSSTHTSTDSLKDQLRHARVEDARLHHRFIIPRGALESLITINNVEKDILARNHALEPADVRLAAEQTCRIARKLFAILAYMKKGPDICSLLKDGVSDIDLPFQRRRSDNGEFTLQRISRVPIETFETWSDNEIEKFDRVQWWMLAPVFEDKQHYELDENTILPFIPFKSNPETAKKKEGAYSEVYAVRLHPAHHEFWAHSNSEVRCTLLSSNVELM